MILNHRYPITVKGFERVTIRLFRKYMTQRKWFHYLYHRIFGHRIEDNTGYAWCEYCDYHQERVMEPLYIAMDLAL